jgi:hypothetical protein
MSENETIRLLLADVDGTLVRPDKSLSPATIAAADAMRQAGVKLAITSGRPPRGMRMLIAPLKLDTPVAGFNGGALVHPDMTPIEAHDLAPAVARKAVEVIVKEGLDAWLYTADKWFIRDPKAPHVARETSTVQFDADVVTDFDDAHYAAAVKIVGVSDDHALVARCETAVRDALKGQASAARSQPYYLDVTHPQANKGAVVDAVATLLGVPKAQIATIGDMPNDELMFANSGFSIAMGNAGDDVKAQAKAVTSRNDADGFAEAVRRFILPRAPRG